MTIKEMLKQIIIRLDKIEARLDRVEAEVKSLRCDLNKVIKINNLKSY